MRDAYETFLLFTHSTLDQQLQIDGSIVPWKSMELVDHGSSVLVLIDIHGEFSSLPHDSVAKKTGYT
jgi:hypothetical protein